MESILWVHTVICTLHESLQYCKRVILDCVILTFDCACKNNDQTLGIYSWPNDPWPSKRIIFLLYLFKCVTSGWINNNPAKVSPLHWLKLAWDIPNHLSNKHGQKGHAMNINLHLNVFLAFSLPFSTLQVAGKHRNCLNHDCTSKRPCAEYSLELDLWDGIRGILINHGAQVKVLN